MNIYKFRERSKQISRDPSRRRREAGFTFLELLISVAILAIITSVSAVSWVGYQREQTIDAAARDLLNALHEAQGNSIGRVDSDGDGNPDQFGVRVVNPLSGNGYLELFYGAPYDSNNVLRATNFESRLEMTAPADGAFYDFIYELRSGKIDVAASTQINQTGAYLPDALNQNCPVAPTVMAPRGGDACLDIFMYNLGDPSQQLTLRIWEHGGTEINPD